MKSLIKNTMLAAAAAALLATPALAGNGNGTPSGSHYTLNIIGVSKGKKANMDNSNRHTIFVPLKSTATGKKSYNNNTSIVDSKIWLTPGPSFKVCDGNAFDEANGCGVAWDGFTNDWQDDGTCGDEGCAQVAKQGAVFMLPCNTNISDDQDSIQTCDGEPSLAYEVYIKALGKPGGSAQITTCATENGGSGDTADDLLICSTENVLLTRAKGKKLYQNVTDELTSLVVVLCDGVVLKHNDVCGGVQTTERIALFAGDTEDWFWNYDNNGLRLAQLRFYEIVD